MAETDVYSWSSSDVSNYLRKLQVSDSVVATLSKNNVNGLVFASLTEDDLKKEPFNLQAFSDVRSVVVAGKHVQQTQQHTQEPRERKPASRDGEEPVFANPIIAWHAIIKSVSIDRDLDKFQYLIQFAETKTLNEVFLALHEITHNDTSLFLHAIKTLAPRVSQSAKDRALSRACQYMAHSQLIEALLRNGANVNVEDERGVTPLFYALSSGDIYVARILIESGADLSHKLTLEWQYNVQNPFVKGGLKAEAVQKLLSDNSRSKDWAPKSVKALIGDTVLAAAAYSGLASMMQVLLQKTEWKPHHLSRALSVALESHSHVIVRIMLARSATGVNSPVPTAISIGLPHRLKCEGHKSEYSTSSPRLPPARCQCQTAETKLQNILKKPLSPLSVGVLLAISELDKNRDISELVGSLEELRHHGATLDSAFCLAPQIQTLYPEVAQFAVMRE